MSKELLAQMEVEEVLLWREVERLTHNFESMSDIKFISTLYCPMFQCMKIENHSNLPASAVEGRWRSTETFALAVRRTCFDSRHHVVQSLL
jgi:hypothetical protein